jgi:hypothetical protein
MNYGWLADWRTDWMAGRLDYCWEGLEGKVLMDGWQAGGLTDSKQAGLKMTGRLQV